MIGQNRSPEAQYNLALQLPIERLVAIMQGQPGPVDQPFALMALKQKRQEKTAAQGLQAQQELRQPTVAQQIASGLPENTGVGALAAPNMGGFADGGIIGMADGAYISPWESHPMFDRLKKQRRARAENQLVGLVPYDPSAPLGEYPSNVNPETGEFYSPVSAPAPASLTPPVAAPAPRTAPARTRPSAAAPAAAGIAQLPVLGSEGAMYPGMDTGEAPAPLAAEPAAPAESPRRTASGIESIGSFQKALEQISGSTKPYVDRMTEVFKQMTPTAEEKEARGQERKGVMALKAAQALLQPGTTAAGARGSAMGQIANLVETYGKEDREDKKAMLGAEINMLGAQAQLAQGNNKAALDMYQHAEKLAFEGIRLDAEKYYKQEELRLKRAGLDTEKELALLRDRTQRYAVDEQTKWRKYHTDALAGSRGARGAITEKDRASFMQRATKQATTDFSNPELAIEYKKKYPNESKAQHITRRTQELFNSFMQQPSAGIPSLQLGSSAIPEDAEILPLPS